MIANLRETTQQNAEQDWLKTNLARISGLMQGQRDLQTGLAADHVRDLAAGRAPSTARSSWPTSDERRRRPSCGSSRQLRLQAAQEPSPTSFQFGEGAVGQAALEGRASSSPTRPTDYVKVTSGLGEALPVNIIVLPILFEEQVLAVDRAGVAAARSPRSTWRSSSSSSETIGVVLIDDHRQQPHRGAARGVAAARAGAAVAVRGAAVPAGRAQALQHRARAAGEVAARVRGAAADPAGGAAPDQRGAAGEGGAARPAEPRHRGQERRDRARARSRSRSGRAARAVLEVQERVPGEHEPRAAHAAELAADPVQAAGRQPRASNLTEKQVEFARTIHPAGTDLLDADLRHPRPVEGRGGQDGGQPGAARRWPTLLRVRRARVPARSPRRRASSFDVERRRRRAAGDRHRRAARRSRSCATCSPTRSSSPRRAASR